MFRIARKLALKSQQTKKMHPMTKCVELQGISFEPVTSAPTREARDVPQCWKGSLSENVCEPLIF
jgi:hypothetical protein